MQINSFLQLTLSRRIFDWNWNRIKEVSFFLVWGGGGVLLATTVVAGIVARIDTVASLTSPAQGGQAPHPARLFFFYCCCIVVAFLLGCFGSGATTFLFQCSASNNWMSLNLTSINSKSNQSTSNQLTFQWTWSKFNYFSQFFPVENSNQPAHITWITVNS